MDAAQMAAFLDTFDGAAFRAGGAQVKDASLLSPIANALPGVGKAIGGTVSYLGGLGKRIFAPAAERFHAGAAAGAKRYASKAMQRVEEGIAKGVPIDKLPVSKNKFMEGAHSLMGGVGKAVGESMPGRAMTALGSRNSDLWRGNFGKVLGRDPLTAGFNVYAGLEGARKGKEVGGTSGAIAGGLGAFGASRAAWAMGDVLKRGLLGDVQKQMLGGKLTALRARPGALRGAMGDWLGKGGKAVEGLMGGQPGKLVGDKGMLQGAINRLQKVRGAAAKDAINVTTPGGAAVDLARSASPFGHGAKGSAAVTSLLTVPLGIGTMSLAGSAADAGGQQAFDAYKRVSSGMHQRQQKQLAQENYLRGISPEFRSTGYNPYAGYGG